MRWRDRAQRSSSIYCSRSWGRVQSIEIDDGLKPRMWFGSCAFGARFIFWGANTPQKYIHLHFSGDEGSQPRAKHCDPRHFRAGHEPTGKILCGTRGG